VIVVREATEEDATVLARFMTAINELVGADSLPSPLDKAPENVNISADRMRQRLQASAGVETAFLAEDDAIPAGFVALRLVPYLGQEVPYAEITQLYVDPKYSGRGVGAALMNAAEDRSRERGCTSLHVLVWASNEGGRKFYAAVGYEEFYVGVEKFL
jgi:GNAT superfamily N-acetyltransferase